MTGETVNASPALKNVKCGDLSHVEALRFKLLTRVLNSPRSNKVELKPKTKYD